MELSYILLYVVIALSLLLLYFIRKKLYYWQDRGVPCDLPHILLGNCQCFSKTLTMHEIIMNIYAKYKGSGPFCGMYFFQRPVALILDPQLAKHILIKNFSNFSNRDYFNNEDNDPLTGHLFLMNGVKWKQLRQKITPTFTTGRMKFMFPTVVKVAAELVEVLENVVQERKILEMHDFTARFITDVIGTCAFGIECHSLKEPSAGFLKIGRDINKIGDMFLYMFIENFPQLARKLKVHQIPKDIHEFFMRAVRETVGFREKHNVRRNDFMDVLIELKNANHEKDKNNAMNVTELTIEKIAAQVFIFFMAGFETSAATISFALYELAQHPAVQHKVRQEINETFAKHNNEFTYECLKELKYLEQIMKETLRMYTPLPDLSRQATNDYTVPGYPQYKIEKGMTIVIPTCAIHRDAEYYAEPHIFKPERFSAAAIAERDSSLWLPFGDGPRSCIGMRFGQMQTCIGLALLLKNFKFSVCEQTTIPMEFDPQRYILSAKHGIQLRVEKISMKCTFKT